MSRVSDYCCTSSWCFDPATGQRTRYFQCCAHVRTHVPIQFGYGDAAQDLCFSLNCTFLDKDVGFHSWNLLFHCPECSDHQSDHCSPLLVHLLWLFSQPLVFLKLLVFLHPDVAIAWYCYCWVLLHRSLWPSYSTCLLHC